MTADRRPRRPAPTFRRDQRSDLQRPTPKASHSLRSQARADACAGTLSPRARQR